MANVALGRWVSLVQAGVQTFNFRCPGPSKKCVKEEISISTASHLTDHELHLLRVPLLQARSKVQEHQGLKFGHPGLTQSSDWGKPVLQILATEVTKICEVINNNNNKNKKVREKISEPCATIFPSGRKYVCLLYSSPNATHSTTTPQHKKGTQRQGVAPGQPTSGAKSWRDQGAEHDCTTPRQRGSRMRRKGRC